MSLTQVYKTLFSLQLKGFLFSVLYMRINTRTKYVRPDKDLSDQGQAAFPLQQTVCQYDSNQFGRCPLEHVL